MLVTIHVHPLVGCQSDEDRLVDVTNAQARYPEAVEERDRGEHSNPGRALHKL